LFNLNKKIVFNVKLKALKRMNVMLSMMESVSVPELNRYSVLRERVASDKDPRNSK
jgi:hypothetical protein